MSANILEIPEIRALDCPGTLVRIPNQLDVPVTQRIIKIIDTPEFQRLAHISQLGLVSKVYPGATHNRFEHSLGVYRMSLLFLKQLASRKKFRERVDARQAELLILAALLHDIGHWPFCHPIEDMQLAGVPSHESFCAEYITRDPIASILKNDWNVDAKEVAALVNGDLDNSHLPSRILRSILSGPIDIDKMDYLYRDSLHAGVPYGQNFDTPRLIRSLCLNSNSDRLAITHKGKTAAELMVFARYVMFSEVYWHHTVRSATTMFQRAFFEWYIDLEQTPDFDGQLIQLFNLRETKFVEQLASTSNVKTAALMNALFGDQRQLYKRAASYSCYENSEMYRRLSQRPFPWLVLCGNHLAKQIGTTVGESIAPEHVLIDAPPVGLEVQFNVEVLNEKSNETRSLGEISPVVETLAKSQFDDFVKQVRIFIAPQIKGWVDSIDLEPLLIEAIHQADAEPSINSTSA